MVRRKVSIEIALTRPPPHVSKIEAFVTIVFPTAGAAIRKLSNATN
jgi:hypothetical protein